MKDQSFPHVLLRLGGRLAFVGIVPAIMKKQAAQSQKRLYPDDSVPASKTSEVFETSEVWLGLFSEQRIDQFLL